MSPVYGQSPKTLITGANGFIGFPVLLHTLKAGYTVRAAVRTQAKADLIFESRPVRSLAPEVRDKLSFVIVPDLLPPNAYDDALRDVEYVIHVASPLAKGKRKPDEFEEEMIVPAIRGTLNMLEAAERAGVKRVVITSSLAALCSPVGPGEDTHAIIYNEKSRTKDRFGPFDDEVLAYQAGKVRSLNEAEKWMKAQNRKVQVVFTHPGIAVGRFELAESIEELCSGSNVYASMQFLGKDKVPMNAASCMTWVEDVAAVHVRALDEEKIPNGQSLVIIQSGDVKGADWKEGRAIVEKAFPEAVKKGFLPNNGWTATDVVPFDISETEKLVDMRFEGLEKQLVELAGQYLEFIAGKS